MENMEMVNEIVENIGFIVDNDNTAEWSLNKIREEQAELKRIEMICKNMIDSYKDRLDKAQQAYDRKTSYLRMQLQQYFAMVTPKVTKTQATYKLGSGTLKIKYGGYEYIRDNDALVRWLKETGKQELVKVKEEANWSDLKKTVFDVKNGVCITTDGEIIEGVKAAMQEDKFEIVLD